MLRLERVSKSFHGLRAVNEVELDVLQGELLGLIGPNGAGKTTLFNLITGVFPPDQGRVFFEGQEINETTPEQRCKLGISRTFQMVRPFLQMTVLDNVTLGRVYGRQALRNRRQAEREAMSFLEQVGLAQRAAEYAQSLTLVDRKRLELARALAAQPKLLLLDELLAGLNPSEVQASMKLIQAINASGVTIVMVEHLVKAVFNIANRIVVLNAGEKIAEGAPAVVAADPHVIDAYLGKSLHAHPA